MQIFGKSAERNASDENNEDGANAPVNKTKIR